MKISAGAALVLVLVLVLVTIGCSSPIKPVESAIPHPPASPVAFASIRASPLASQLIAHPSGATDVVLRMWTSGGLRYPGATVELLPTFTLYGDGRVIYATWTPGPNGSTVIEHRQARLTEEQVAELVEYALDPGGLATAREQYTDGPFADDVTTNFEVHAAGYNKVVAVYGLGHLDEGAPDAAAHQALEELKKALSSFGAEVVAGRVADLGEYEPEAYRVTLDQPFGELEANREWPWPDLEPDDFGPDGSGFRVRILTAAQAAAIADPPMSAPDDIVVRAPDGAEYLIRLLALLPDQLP